MMPSGSAAGFDVDEAAVLVGRCAWLEYRLFEILGGWVRSTADPAIKLALHEQSAQHAWHGELFAALIPELDGIDAEALVAASGPAGERFVAELAASDGGLDQTTALVVRLTGLGRVVLPLLVGGYSDLVDRASPVRDRPLRRVLDLVLVDEVASWRWADRVLRAAIDSEDHIDAAIDQQRRLEHLAHEAGLLVAG